MARLSGWEQPVAPTSTPPTTAGSPAPPPPRPVFATAHDMDGVCRPPLGDLEPHRLIGAEHDSLANSPASWTTYPLTMDDQKSIQCKVYGVTMTSQIRRVRTTPT